MGSNRYDSNRSKFKKEVTSFNFSKEQILLEKLEESIESPKTIYSFLKESQDFKREISNFNIAEGSSIEWRSCQKGSSRIRFVK